jgi:hypothetical protein
MVDDITIEQNIGFLELATQVEEVYPDFHRRVIVDNFVDGVVKNIYKTPEKSLENKLRGPFAGYDSSLDFIRDGCLLMILSPAIIVAEIMRASERSHFREVYGMYEKAVSSFAQKKNDPTGHYYIDDIAEKAGIKMKLPFKISEVKSPNPKFYDPEFGYYHLYEVNTFLRLKAV